MDPGAAVVARGECDWQDRLLRADEQLADLQRACGGELPGLIAVPELLALVRSVRSHRRPLARAIRAQDDQHAISVWVEAAPQGGGCTLAVSAWRTSQLPAEDPRGAPDSSLLAQIADAYCRLDGRQNLQAVEVRSGALAALESAMAAGIGRPWTDFVAVEAGGHRQPLHWRLLDRATVTAEGAEGRWRAHLAPQFDERRALVGFDLHLVPVGVPELPGGPAEAAAAPTSAQPALAGVLGRDLGPLLRQPISRIVANAETIRSQMGGPIDEQYAAYAGDIADAGRHLLELVEDLADLEAIEAETFTTAPDEIDLAEAARRAAGILRVRAAERGIVVETPGDELPLPAIGELRRVLQVLLNLLGNALRYAPEGSTVRLEGELRGGRAALTVADEGAGLDAAQQAKVFDKFERLGRSGDGGSGLGLYISRRLARAMGGDLTVASTPGQGAGFTLELPAR